MKTFIARRAIKKYPESGLPTDQPAALRTALRSFAATKFHELIVTGDDELTFATVLAVLLASEGLRSRKSRSRPRRGAGEAHQSLREVGGGAPLRTLGQEEVEDGCRSTSRTPSITATSCRCAAPTRSSPERRGRAASSAPAAHRTLGLADARMSPREVADGPDYCMYCHERQGSDIHLFPPRRPGNGGVVGRIARLSNDDDEMPAQRLAVDLCDQCVEKIIFVLGR